MASVTRFNLLLLEEGELFFEDYAAILYLPSNNVNNNESNDKNKKLSGRLKVASKNLIFEPHTISYPIMRFKYLNMESLHMDKSKQHLIVITSQIVEMKSHNVIKPYIFKEINKPLSKNGIYIFEPSYSSLNDFVGLVAKIYQITKGKNNNMHNYDDEISKIQNLRENRIPFDSSWFVDINEIEQLNKPLIVSKLTPLVELRGQIQITNKRIYFQPFHNQSSKPMLKYNLNNIANIYRRRQYMLPIAIEIIFSVSEKSGNSLLLAFENEVVRDDIFELLIRKTNNKSKTTNKSLQYMQNEWMKGNISNYEYLMVLNELSGRSFNDITQYPVFPWIISDYKSSIINLNNPNIYRDLSKPIGALNPIRLKSILKRYKEMPSPKFMYGSHYSTPGYVMYFLVRQHPDYMLRFQNGKFDAPDRLFSSIQRTWDSAYQSLTDVKELIPQFYHVKYYKFLLNHKNLNLGIRSDKKEVHHVHLPKWANNSPQKFVKIMRQALESKYTSENLHKWIDLIFGYKQLGDEAEKSFNKFYYLTYEGAVNIKSIKDKSKLKSIQMQINEFGQTPCQLFSQPHPQKYSSIIKEEEEEEKKDIYNYNYENIMVVKKYKHKIISPHTHRITDICISKNNKYLYSVSHDSTLSIYSFNNESIINSFKISKLALSSLVDTPIGICIGSWDNNIYLYNENKLLSILKSHGDAISCIENINNIGICSGSWDNTIKIWKYNKYNNGPEITYKCNSEIRCISTSNNLIISGDENGNIYMFDTKIKQQIKQWTKGHKDEITSICWLPNKLEFITSSSDCYIKHWNATNGKLIKKILITENLNSIYTDGKLIISGGELGKIRLFNLNNINEIYNHSLNLNLKTNTHSISKLYLTNDAQKIIIGLNTNQNNIHLFELNTNQNSTNQNNTKNNIIHNNNYFSHKIKHKPTKSLPSSQNKTLSFGSSFGSNAFAKLTQSASNLFSFGSNQHK